MPAFVAGSASRTAGSFSRSGMKGETTAPYDSQHALPARTAMSGYARPELLASAEWLADNIGRPGLRILDGGYGAWVGEGRQISNARTAPERAVFTPRALGRLRLTTADVRGLLGSPDVLLIDARPPAEYRGLEGNARRLGHIPGAINVP